ncbi:PP2C family protein-serine/threonine phosphatase [Phytohabitans suffuscus]|uniref:Phosphatase n=1 Tax=Phytohabitans suffuscus TaxID=624315 RepID=A0A6F8YZH3_9ACTN|nr:PP2C family protein-serine/threonine phosphatase [Phytohabitans suffuscus]BCB91537.1 phosphatase [Phytohabitans suffuscus]
MTVPDPLAWHGLIAGLVEVAHFVGPSGLAAIVEDSCARVGVGATILLVDHEQERLRALTRDLAGSPGPPRSLPVAASIAGRAFMTLTAVAAATDPPGLWMPIVNGTERIGVLEVRLPAGADPADPATVSGARLLAGLIGHLITSKTSYGDALAKARRSRPMTPAAELLWQLLPPLTFATDHFVLAAVLEPCYEVGGDAFDYTVDDGVARFAVYDGVGKGFPAALTTAAALGASRSSRRAGADLAGTAEAVDAALKSQFTDSRFVTAVLAEFDLHAGHLRYVGAGHPPPVLLRRGKVVRALAGARRTPLGVPGPTQVASERLEPGDRVLLYSDGITEARDAHGALFGLERLVDLVERHAADGLPIAETTRRISHAVRDHQGGPPADDATLLLLEWSEAAARRSVP